jgi:hypothetical protein
MATVVLTTGGTIAPRHQGERAVVAVEAGADLTAGDSTSAPSTSSAGGGAQQPATTDHDTETT